MQNDELQGLPDQNPRKGKGKMHHALALRFAIFAPAATFENPDDAEVVVRRITRIVVAEIANRREPL